MELAELISPKRISCELPVNSKKRLLECISGLLHMGAPNLNETAAFQSLFEREKLGSTGIGHGVALPHGRLKGLNHAIGAFAVLKEAMDYESIDNQPVKLVFALLVPEEATDEHLQLLSKIASLMSNEDLRKQLLTARDPEEIYKTLTTQASD